MRVQGRTGEWQFVSAEISGGNFAVTWEGPGGAQLALSLPPIEFRRMTRAVAAARRGEIEAGAVQLVSECLRRASIN